MGQGTSKHRGLRKGIMDEFGETPAFYIEPKDHVEGEPYPEDFLDRLDTGLKSVGLTWEIV
jgi:hypothetical protein